MKYKRYISQRNGYMVCFLFTGIVLFFAIKDLFFFDEDIFVTDKNSWFMQTGWQRLFLVKLSYQAHYLFGVPGPAGFHSINLLLHLCNAVLALLIIKELVKMLSNHLTVFQQQVIPFIFFIFFLISPIHSEPLCYLLARCSTLATLFCLGSILFFLKARQKKRLFIFCSLTSFLAALFCYEVSWMLPFTIVALVALKSYVNNEPVKKNILVVLPYFLLFAAWFIIKVVVIDKMAVSDYNDGALLSVGIATLVKNIVVLFLRNFIPPFEHTVTFLMLSAFFLLLSAMAFFKMYRQNKKMFYLLLVLAAATFFSFFAAAVIGIDSHDSESERYIYFSSVFAIMFLSFVLPLLITNKRLLLVTAAVIFAVYARVLFTTIGYYQHAGAFSKKYVQQVNIQVQNNDTAFFINMPAQYKGALLFRAKSKLANNTDDKVNVMQEYLQYLYNKKVLCVVLSGDVLKKVPDNILTVEKPLDSVAVYFPGTDLHMLYPQFRLQHHSNSHQLVIGLKDNALYFFR